MDRVADIIAFQHAPTSDKTKDGREIPIESQNLKIGMDFDIEELRSENVLRHGKCAYRFLEFYNSKFPAI